MASGPAAFDERIPRLATDRSTQGLGVLDPARATIGETQEFDLPKSPTVRGFRRWTVFVLSVEGSHFGSVQETRLQLCWPAWKEARGLR